jgi:hypothetical protein
MRSPYSLCVCVSPLNFFVFSAVRVLSKENRRLILPKTSCDIYVFGQQTEETDSELNVN